MISKLGFLLSLLIYSHVNVAEAQWNQNYFDLPTPWNTAFVFKNGTIVVSAKQEIKNGVLSIVDGRIDYVGTDETKILPEANVIDLKGKRVYPAFIEAFSHMGLKKPEKAKSPWEGGEANVANHPSRRDGHWNEAVTPEYQVITEYRPKKDEEEKLRSMGFGVVQVVPNDKIFRGKGFVMSLNSEDLLYSLIKYDSSAVISFNKGSSKQLYPSSLMGAMALIRQAFMDTDYSLKSQSAFYPFEKALAEIVQGEIPVIFKTDDHLSTMRAHKLMRTTKAKVLYYTKGKEYRRLNDIVALNARGFIQPLEFPYPFYFSSEAAKDNVELSELRHYQWAPHNTQLLLERGQKVALSVGKEIDPHKFWKNLAKSLESGLTPQQALRALTQTPAEFLGLQEYVGTLEKGKMANFIVTEHDIFSTKFPVIEATWVRGREFIHEQKLSAPRPSRLSPTGLKGSPTFPNTMYGLEELPVAKAYLLEGAKVWTQGPLGLLEKANVFIKDGKIVEVSEQALELDESVIRIDAEGMHITPGLVDEHSHIATKNGVNESAHPVSAEVSIGDVVQSDDVNIFRILSGGVTTSQLLHGSANPIGGQSAIIKHRWGMKSEDLLFKDAPKFIKFALGENVKQANWGDDYTSRYPQTRMGVRELMQDTFSRARAYEERKKMALEEQGPFKKDLQMEVVLEVLNGQRFVTSHSYVQSEILMLMELAEENGFFINTFTHILEGYKVADELALHGANASTFSDWWAYKFEVKDAIAYNAAIMASRGVNVMINSDDSEMARRLNQEAAKVLKYGGYDLGLTEEDALKMVTLNPAKALKIDHLVGSLEPGKHADVVVWSHHPLSQKAKTLKVFVDGRLYFDRKRADQRRQAQLNERQELLKLMESSNEKKVEYNPSDHEEHSHMREYENHGYNEDF